MADWGAIGAALGSAGINALGNIGGGIVGGIYGQQASDEEYVRNKRLMLYQAGINNYFTEKANQFAADQSALAFARDMDAYGKRYQMTVEDLKKAGLNPLLAVGGMSAVGQPSYNAPHSAQGSVSGSSVSRSDVGSILGDSIGRAFGSLGSALEGYANLQRLDNESRVADAQVDLIKSQAAREKADTLNKPSVRRNLDADSRKKNVDAIAKSVATVGTAASSAYAVKSTMKYLAAKAGPKAAKIATTAANPSSAVGIAQGMRNFGLLAYPLLLGGVLGGAYGVGAKANKSVYMDGKTIKGKDGKAHRNTWFDAYSQSYY